MSGNREPTADAVRILAGMVSIVAALGFETPVLVEAGARLDLEDAAWHATPVGWAEYYQSAGPAERRDGQWAEIAAYLRERTR